MKILSAKYITGTRILNANLGSGVSYIWRSIIKAMVELKSGFQVRIGKGDASIWYDRWLEEDCIANLVPYVNIQDIHLRVKDIFFNGEWHFETLATQLPINIRLRIMSIFLDGVTEDIIIWGSSNTRVYTARYAYKLLTMKDSVQLPPSISWSGLWKLKLLKNIKFFFWLVLHECLPTNQFRVHHHMSTDSSCHRCGSTIETLVHTLRDCTEAHKVWKTLQFDKVPLFFSASCKDWVQDNLYGPNTSLFAITCWFIWKARNSSVFEDVDWELWMILSKIFTLRNSVLRAFGDPMTKSTERQVTWNPPQEHFIKLNVDGTSLGNPGRSGFGGIFRNRHGEWLLGFSGFCDFNTNLKAELMAISQELEIAWEQGYKAILCDSDSTLAIASVGAGL